VKGVCLLCLERLGLEQRVATFFFCFLKDSVSKGRYSLLSLRNNPVTYFILFIIQESSVFFR
jgi:hypothetical protein